MVGLYKRGFPKHINLSYTNSTNLLVHARVFIVGLKWIAGGIESGVQIQMQAYIFGERFTVSTLAYRSTLGSSH